MFTMNTSPSTKDFPTARPSASMRASRAAELARLRSMTVEQRIKEALALADRFRGVIPSRKA